MCLEKTAVEYVNEIAALFGNRLPIIVEDILDSLGYYGPPAEDPELQEIFDQNVIDFCDLVSHLHDNIYSHIVIEIEEIEEALHHGPSLAGLAKCEGHRLLYVDSWACGFEGCKALLEDGIGSSGKMVFECLDCNVENILSLLFYTMARCEELNNFSFDNLRYTAVGSRLKFEFFPALNGLGDLPTSTEYPPGRNHNIHRRLSYRDIQKR